MTSKRFPLLTLLAAATLLPLGARDFADHLPAGAMILIQGTDLPANRDKYQSLPYLQRMDDFDWKRPLVTLYEQLLRNEEIDDSAPLPQSGAELKQTLDLLTQRMDIIGSHFNGALALSVGDLENAVEVFQRHSRERLETFNPDNPGATTAKELAQRETERTLAEMKALGGEIVFHAEVRDADALMDHIAGWVNDLLRKQESAEELLVLKTLDWDGHPVYTLALEADPDADEPAPDHASLWWTARDGVWTITGSEASLRRALENLRTPPADSLSASSAYQEALQFLGEQDSFTFINLPRIDALLRKGIGEEALRQTDTPGGLSPAKVLDWLALDALLPYALGFRLDREGMHGTGRFGFSRETALSRILLEPTDAPAPMPPFLHRDFGQISSTRWSLPRVLRQVEKELIDLDPNIGAALGMGKGMLTAQLGMDIQTGFLDHFGNGLIAVQEMDAEVMQKLMEANQNGDPREMLALSQRHPTNGQHYLMALQVDNLQAVSSGLNTLLSNVHPAGMPEPEMYRGHPIHNPLPQNDGEDTGLLRYTFLDDYLLWSIGDPGLLHKAITASNQPENRLENDPDFLRMRDRFPAAQLFEYAGGDQQAATWDVIATSLGGVFENPADVPDFSVFFDSVQGAMSVMTRQGTVLEIQTLTTFAPPEE